MASHEATQRPNNTRSPVRMVSGKALWDGDLDQFYWR